MRLLVGLGNPGKQYEETRHNTGFRVVDRLKKTVNAAPLESTGWFKLFDGRFEDERILFLYPLTFMNRSGIAVSDIALQFDIETNNIIVIYDDFNLPLGSIRIRPGGSAGGHNGLSSVLEVMQTNDIPRVRLGIFNEALFSKYTDAADFVLSAFETDEEPIVTTMIQQAHNATLMMMKDGISKAMNSFNKVAEDDKSTKLNKNRES